MKSDLARTFVLAALALRATAVGQAAVDPDPNGVLLKPIPDRLIVLTFDDGCASGYTVIAPILKPLGFGGSFYVCDFDSFKTRKDWYLTCRQMQAMAAEGFEIGNHTVGHFGGLEAFLSMEDQMLANHVPKPTTVCWPIYQVAWPDCPELARNGYTFGRGGHDRPYRPTVDNPFDVPSFSVSDGVTVETFAKQAQQACQGRVVVFTFHGVPDREHPPVGTEPETFKVMMQYLKDNNYQVIAMRDLAKFIDPAKAAKLPSTANDVKGAPPFLSVKDDKPNAFTWSKAAPGNWSEGSGWSNNLADGTAPAPAGRPDYVLNFSLGGNHAVTHDLQDGFQLNQLNLDEKFGVNLAGKRVTFVANSATGGLPQIHVNTRSEGNPVAIPMELAADLSVNVMLGGRVFLKGLISGKGSLTLNCPGSTNEYRNWGILRIENKTNTYSGGTIINGGQLFLLYAEQGLGTGPVTLNDGADIRLECHNVANPLIINGGTIEGGTWNAPITLNGIARFAGTMNLNESGGGMSGPGGFTQIGPIGPFSRVNAGELSLWGRNTYTGPTTVHMGTLIIRKAVSLYNADPANWTATRITVHPAATLYIPAGGPDEFTGEQAGTLLTKLTTSVDHNGLMAGSMFCLDTVKATGTVTVASDITDSKGPGGGAFVLKKCGAGTLQLSGSNTYTGRTILEGGTLSVASLNRVVKGRPGSSLGAPKDVENGEIVVGKDKTDGECALIYTGTGETSNRVLNLAGKNSTVTIDQSGNGLLKLTSDFLISGYGSNKTLVLAGDTAGSGELAGAITDPHDRTGKATTSLTKSGNGTWTLSGSNSYSGPTKVTQGALSLANAASLADRTDVHISDGATLDLNFEGEMRVGKLYLDGKLQPAGRHDAKNSPKYIRGKGVLKS